MLSKADFRDTVLSKGEYVVSGYPFYVLSVKKVISNEIMSLQV